MLPLLLLCAIVVEDQTALRAAPQESTPRQAVLWRGDWLEVRGERAGYLQVYDHRHERPGYVRPAQVRTYKVEEASAPALHAVLDFVRDTPGAESLGIGYAALYLRAAPAAAVGSEVFEALGLLADRLARRASARRAGGSKDDAALAAHLEVAQSYGVRYTSREDKDHTQVCYDGEAFRRVLALSAAPQEKARAALALTRPDCIDPELGPSDRQAVQEWALGVLQRADPAAVPAALGNRVRLRRAGALAELAFHSARQGEAARAASQSELAVRELALVSRPELYEEDAGWYDAVAVRVGASRWAAEPARAAGGPQNLVLRTRPGQPGETCVSVVAVGRRADQAEKKDPEKELITKCTYGLVWNQSLRIAPRGQALVVAVQPLPSWNELWIFHRDDAAASAPAASPAGSQGAAAAEKDRGDPSSGWRLTTLSPAAVDPRLGNIELAGFSPDGARLLIAREAEVEGVIRREFQVVRLSTLRVENQARSADRLAAFRSWQSADWQSRTLALR